MIIRKQLAFDIETMPDMSVVDLLPEIEASKVLKDPEKIKLDLERRKQEQIEKMALNPLFGKIACISIIGENEEHFLIGDEKQIIEDFFKITCDCQLISYNGINFDIPFIYKRAIKNNIPDINLYQLKQFTNKYDCFKHIDIMNEFCNWGQFEKLDTLSKIYLNESKNDFDIKTIPQLIETEEGKQQLKEYCLQDTRLTWKLAIKFGFVETFEEQLKKEQEELNNIFGDYNENIESR